MLTIVVNRKVYAMPKRKTELGLGRGLNSLLGDPELQISAESASLVPISQVEPGLNQPRKKFDPESLQELTESITQFGVIQPLIVRRLSTGYYQIIAGERRWRAAKAAGLMEVPVNVIEADDRKVLEIGLVENLQRSDLNPLEEAQGYKTLMEQYGLTQEQVSERLGKARSTIANALRLLQLPDDVLSLLEDGTLSTGHAKALLSLDSPDLQSQTAKQIVQDHLSVRQTESLVNLLLKQHEETEDKNRPDSASQVKIYLDALSEKLSGSLGRRVRIQGQGRKGRVELEYYNEDDLESLLGLLETLGTKEETVS